MPLSWLILIVLSLAATGFFMGRARAMASAGGDARRMHSLPVYYGTNVALFVITPAFGLMILWLLVQPAWIENRVATGIPESAIGESSTLDLVMNDVRRIADGLDLAVAEGVIPEAGAGDMRAETTDVRELLGGVGVALGAVVEAPILRAAQSYREMNATGSLWMAVAVIAVALAGFGGSYALTNMNFRARNVVERGILVLLIAAASIAILTTLGIVVSMLFETRNFFQQYSWVSFFFGLEWAPDFRGNSSLSILPLLWGTLYISFIALLVAVPIGLFAAIYMSEYAGPKMRAVAKPLIEILAGIPTIVYGLFALITVGPLLRDYFAMPMGLGESASSVVTAGIVMGVMLIPFVSSLSDDIINAVPQAMRDGSFGLGATHSETIRQVVIPAALPGIVGAILLAASRAIGETMIVVLGAGAAAAQFNRGLGELVNPFEAMTTVTVKIVSQLTGDTDFAAPETLVAFALGPDAFRHHAGAECPCPLDRAPIPGAVRMTDMNVDAAPAGGGKGSLLAQDARTKKRNAAEARFRMYGLAAICVGLLALVWLVTSILTNGAGAFQQTFVTLEVALAEDKLDKTGNRDPEDIKKVSTFGYAPLIAAAMEAKMAETGIAIEGLSAKDAAEIVSKEAPGAIAEFRAGQSRPDRADGDIRIPRLGPDRRLSEGPRHAWRVPSATAT